MKYRFIISIAALALLALIGGIWLGNTNTSHDNRSQDGLQNSTATPASSGKPVAEPGSRKETIADHFDDSEPPLIYTDLTLTEANRALTRLVGRELPAGTKMIKPGHFALPPDEALKVCEQLMTIVRKNYNGDNAWEQLDGGQSREAFEAERTDLKMPAGTFDFNMVPAWHTEGPLPRFSLAIDPASGVCLFTKCSNYDP